MASMREVRSHHRMIQDLQNGMKSPRNWPDIKLGNSTKTSWKLLGIMVMSTKQTSLSQWLCATGFVLESRNRRDTLRHSRLVPFPLGGHLDRSLSRQSLPATPQSQLQSASEITNQPVSETMAIQLASSNTGSLSNLVFLRSSVCGSGENEILILRSHELSIRNSITQKAARNEILTVEQGTGFPLFHQHQERTSNKSEGCRKRSSAEIPKEHKNHARRN